MFGHSMHPQQNQGLDVRGSVNLTYLLVNGFATCFTVFLRRGFGGEAFGFNAIIGVIIMLFYMQSHPGSGAMFDFFGCWWIALLCHRIGYWSRRRRGHIVHSRFDGVSWIGIVLPFLDRAGLARVAEIPLCIFGGAALAHYDQAVGRFVFFGAFALLVKNMMDGWVDRKRVQRMHDAAIEQQYRLGRWRSGKF